MPSESESELQWDANPTVDSPEARNQGRAAMRKAQIASYEGNALRNAYSREACFGAGSAKMLEISHLLEGDIFATIAAAGSAIGALPKLTDAFKYYLATSKLAAKYSELELKWKQMQQRLDDEESDQLRKRPLH
jgi:hypothetical protein